MKNKKIFLFLGNEEDLIENGFTVYSKKYPYENGGYPLIHRGIRHDVVIYTNIEREPTGVEIDGAEVFRVVKQKDIFRDDEVEEYLLKNILYSKYTETKLYSKYPILDLIEKGLVVEINNIIAETERSKELRGK